MLKVFSYEVKQFTESQLPEVIESIITQYVAEMEPASKQLITIKTTFLKYTVNYGNVIIRRNIRDWLKKATRNNITINMSRYSVFNPIMTASSLYTGMSRFCHKCGGTVEIISCFCYSVANPNPPKYTCICKKHIDFYPF